MNYSGHVYKRTDRSSLTLLRIKINTLLLSNVPSPTNFRIITASFEGSQLSTAFPDKSSTELNLITEQL